MRKLLLMTFILPLLAITACNKDKNDPADQVTNTQISDTQKTQLFELYDEEKLAHDIYEQFFIAHSYTPFEHIMGAEEYHMTRVGEIMTAYGLQIPVNPPGVFQFQRYQDAYDTWQPQGVADGQEACMIGAYIEEMDILDIIYAIENIGEKDDILAMYEELKMGSENHLRAFNRFLEMEFGVDYQPQLMDQAMFDAIIAASGNHGGHN